MKVPDGYVRSKCCLAYQHPSLTTCIRCGKPCETEEAVEHTLALDGACAVRDCELWEDYPCPYYRDCSEYRPASKA